MNYSRTTSASTFHCPSLSMGHVYGMMALNILSTVIGTIGNLLVICTVYRNVSLQTISHFWLVSMAVADLFVTALGQPLFSIFLGLQIGDECNEIVSQAFRLIANFSCSASVLHLCFISIDRCLVIVRPHQKSLRTKKRFKIALVISWTLPVIYGVLRLTVSKKGTSYFTVIAVGLCYMTIILCYALIILNVRKQVPDHAVERRLAATMAMVVVTFIVCWFPLLYLRSAFAEENYGVAYDWARTLALSNSSMNPWIYCFRIAEFREAYRRLLSCQWKPACSGPGGTGEEHEMNATQFSEVVVTQEASVCPNTV